MAGSRTLGQLPTLRLFILLLALFFHLLRADKPIPENSLDFAQATVLDIEEAIQVGMRPLIGPEETERRSNLACKQKNKKKKNFLTEFSSNVRLFKT